MFRFPIIALLAVGALATPDELWNHWKRVHNKVYNDQAEEVNRRAQWEINVKRIQNHNLRHDLGLVTYTLGLNQFTDLSFDEFKAQYLSGFKPDPSFHSRGILYRPTNNDSVPESVDWRESGYVTPVKDQKKCGSCWAFSTTGAIEGQYAKNFKERKSFSEQLLVDCTADYGNHGCHGGLMENAFEYMKHYGLEEEGDYPYHAVEGECKYDKHKIRVYVGSYSTVHSGDEKKLEKMVADNGPVSVAVDVESDFMMYKSGIFTSTECTPRALNHAVLAVGYGVENGAHYWIVKNSWSEQWGERGYIRMAKDRSNMCGIASMASVPTVEK